jgi:predicted metalloendopeptidase
MRTGGLRRIAAQVALLATCPVLALNAQMALAHGRAPLERTVDTTIAPGDDFFAYANGAWLASAVIPQGKERWAARDEINDVTRRRIAQLLDDARTAPRGSRARKVADFQAAWSNEAAIEALGRAPIQSELDSIDAVADKSMLARLLGRWMRADVDPLNWGVYQSGSILGLSVEPSIHGEKTYVAFLLQGGLGLHDRDAYLSTEPRFVALRAQYAAYLGGLLAFTGVERADRRAAAVLELETAIARSQATRAQSANDHNADSVWRRADFSRRAPGIDWTAFFDASGLGGETTLVAWQPSAIAGVGALVASQPLETWRDYLRARVVDAYADVLPRDVSQPAAALRAAEAGSSSPAPSREQRALDATQVALGDEIGALYAERWFPAAQKARVRRIVNDVTNAFIARAERATWMSPATKARALAKLKALYVGVGYPEQSVDDRDLVVGPTTAVDNLRRVAARDRRRALARLGRPVDMRAWLIEPHTVGAVLVFQQNAYDFAAALLQPPKFDPAASDAACYGAIGAIIGHDVSHFVDVLGAEYDVDGALRHWWTPEDASRFKTLSEPLVSQFSSYRPFADSAVDGNASRTENIADLAGLTAAFDAYRASLGARAADRSYVRQQDREFFIAFAQSWRTRTSDAALRAQLSSDHAPERYRVATVRNLDAWYDAFDVRPGQRLYLAPADRVRVW